MAIREKKPDYVLGSLMVIINVVCWISSAEIFQELQEPTSPNYFNQVKRHNFSNQTLESKHLIITYLITLSHFL
jgi:hypothetical protein